MAFLPRRDEEPSEPVDDTADFVLTERQAAIRRRRETVRQMVKVAAQIHASLTTYARRLPWVSEREYQRGRRTP